MKILAIGRPRPEELEMVLAAVEDETPVRITLVDFAFSEDEKRLEKNIEMLREAAREENVKFVVFGEIPLEFVMYLLCTPEESWPTIGLFHYCKTESGERSPFSYLKRPPQPTYKNS